METEEKNVIPEDIQKNAVSIIVLPFPGVVADKDQGIKVLEEASEFREAYDILGKTAVSEVGEDVINQLAARMANEAVDTIQAAVNALYAVFRENTEAVISDVMSNVYYKNTMRGWYGEEAFNNMKELMEEGSEDDGDEQA